MADPNLDLVAPSTALVVSAFVRKNRLAPTDVAAVIAAVHSALTGLGEPAPAAQQEPAVGLRRLVTPDKIYCAECGKPFKSLRRHLMASHRLTPSAYRAKWGLKKDHPNVAPNYSASRSAIAVSRGLGRKAAPETASENQSGPLKSAKGEAQGAGVGSAVKAKPRRAKQETATKES